MAVDADVVDVPPTPIGRRMLQVPIALLDGLRRLIGLGVPVTVPADARDTGATGWLVLITLATSIALVVLAVAMTAARAGAEWSVPAYWASVVAIVAMPAFRLSQPGCPRHEHLALVLLVGAALYACKVLHAPDGFVHFDELLHVATANSLIEHEQLFVLNTLLPISPLFPGLEIVTAAMVKLTGLSVFVSGTLLVGLCRLSFLIGFFCLIERLTGSARIASITCFLYIGNANFSLFHAQYAYESMAVTLLMLGLLAERIDSEQAGGLRFLGLVVPFIVALAVTHHTTASFIAAFLALIAGLELFRPVSAWRKVRLLLLAAIGFASVLGWSRMTGDPTAGYIGPLIEQGLTELYRFITGQAGARRLFVSDDGVEQAFLRRFVSLGAMALVLAGLAVGFLRSLTIAGAGGRPGSLLAMIGDLFRWQNSRLVAIVLLTLVFPVSLAFRLTVGGWELGSRLGAFSFVGVAAVVAIALCCFWQGTSASVWRWAGSALVIIIVAMGGIIIGWGPSNLPSGYRVAGDALSVERMGIDAAKWSRSHLGEDNRFGADRINRLLLAAYGRQRLVTTLFHRIDVSPALFNPRLTPSDRYNIRVGRIDYLLVDMRLTLERPLMGVYFEKGEPPALALAPPTAAALSKFNDMEGVGRPYDNGAIWIVDVRALRDGL